jgi:hypothetical protein
MVFLVTEDRMVPITGVAPYGGDEKGHPAWPAAVWFYQRDLTIYRDGTASSYAWAPLRNDMEILTVGPPIGDLSPHKWQDDKSDGEILRRLNQAHKRLNGKEQR